VFYRVRIDQNCRAECRLSTARLHGNWVVAHWVLAAGVDHWVVDYVSLYIFSEITSLPNSVKLVSDGHNADLKYCWKPGQGRFRNTGYGNYQTLSFYCLLNVYLPEH